jgi:DNA-binding MarR family transcriptional regulator
LSARLKELEAAGVVERRLLPRPEGSVVYALTDYGRELETIVLAMGRWGAQRLDEPRDGEIVTTDSLVMALRSTFHPAAGRGLRLTYELRVDDIVIGARVRNGKVVLLVSACQAWGNDRKADVRRQHRAQACRPVVRPSRRSIE